MSLKNIRRVNMEINNEFLLKIDSEIFSYMSGDLSRIGLADFRKYLYDKYYKEEAN